jgi:hypothetical protein
MTFIPDDACMSIAPDVTGSIPKACRRWSG